MDIYHQRWQIFCSKRISTVTGQVSLMPQAAVGEGGAVTEAAAGRGSTRRRRLHLHLILLAFLVGAPHCPESWGGHPARLLGPAVLYQAGNVVDPSKDGCRQASFLHLPVSQPCQYHGVYSFFQEGHRGVAGPACADLGEGAVIGDPSHPSSKCLGGLLWHLPGLMQGQDSYLYFI